MNRWSLSEGPRGVLCLRATPWGRLSAAASTFAIAAVCGLLAMLVFFGPDVLLDGSGVTAGFFAGFLGAGALLIATIAAAMRLVASWRWEFDPRRGVVRFATRTSFGHRMEDELSLRHVESVELGWAGALSGGYTLSLRLEDGSSAVLVRARTGRRELEAVHARLRAAIGGDGEGGADP